MKKCNILQVRVRVSACSLNPVDSKVKPLLFLSRISRRSPLNPLAAGGTVEGHVARHDKRPRVRPRRVG
jgi:hypothetical protein